MLINFSVKNFKSFRDLNSFSMVAGRTKRFSERVKALRDDLNVLSFGALYGANASGKSNLQEALLYFCLLSIVGAPKEKYISDVSFHGTESSVSYFEIDLEIKGRIFNYGIEFDFEKNVFVYEWLLEYEKANNERYIFKRDCLQNALETHFNASPDVSAKIDLYREELQNLRNTSVIQHFYDKIKISKTLPEESFEEIVLVRDFLAESFNIVGSEDPVDPVTYYINEDSLDKLSSFLNRYDTGIKRLQKEKMSSEDARQILPKSFLKKVDEIKAKHESSSHVLRNRSNIVLVDVKENGDVSYSKIVFIHEINGKEVIMSLSEESDGTVRIMDLAPIVLDKKQETVYFVDELDRCLHPLLLLRFIKDFFDTCSKTDCHTQLIVTTHESLLMDLELLRRDEIWFAEKKDGASELYSLEEFQERFDKKANKSYLSGRYGAVPHFLPVMGEVISDED